MASTQTLASRILHAHVLLAAPEPLYCWLCSRQLGERGWHFDELAHEPVCDDERRCHALYTIQEAAECVPGELDEEDREDLARCYALLNEF